MGALAKKRIEAEETFLFPDSLPLIAKRNNRARRVALRLDVRARNFILVIPKGMSDKKAFDFARAQKKWMIEKSAALPSRITFDNGQSVPVKGIMHELDIAYIPERKTTHIFFENEKICIKSAIRDPSLRIKRFLKHEALKQLEALSHEKAGIIGCRVSKVSVRDPKSRWGSCSPNGNISYSWRLIFAPYQVMDYIVAHEVAHLKHLDHSPAFWRVCQSLSEDYELGRHWIRDNPAELMRYG